MNLELERVVAVAAAGRVERGALLARLDEDANFVNAFLASRGNDYLAAHQENSLKASAVIDAVKLDKDARYLAGAVS
jgi:hypothetical protein